MTDPSVPPQWQPYAAPYVAPRPPADLAPAPAPEPSAGLGILALALAAVAAVGAPVVAALASWRVALGAGKEIASRPRDEGFDLSILTPVRDWVMLGEAAFWAGTLLGIAALVVGIIGIVKDRGRIPGIVAVVVALLGPVVFFLAAALALQAGYPAGASIGG